MIGSLLTVYTAASYALGGYNVTAFLIRRGIKLRRRRKEDRRRSRAVKAAVDYARNAYERLQAGDIDQEAVENIIAMIKGQGSPKGK